MDQLLIILMDGLVVASRIFLISAGLTVIYGVMRILNIAHGALYTLGAYAASTLVLSYLGADLPRLGSYLVLATAALVVGLVAGPLIERGILRWLYGHEPALQLLATFALFLIIEDLIRIGWRGQTFNPFEPFTFLGNFRVAGVSYPGYYLLLLAVAIICGLGMWVLMNRSRFGRQVIAVTADPEMAVAMGIRLSRVYVITFSIGAILAALAGAFTAPTQAVIPSMGIEVIVVSFAVVVIGGLGSLGGAALGSAMVGLAEAATIHLAPTFTLFIIYLVMTLVLLIRPNGLFAQIEARRI